VVAGSSKEKGYCFRETLVLLREGIDNGGPKV